MPRNKADFHGVTFEHTAGRSGARIVAIHPEHGVVGHMLLHALRGRSGRPIRNISVDPQFQRMGIATGMWNYANAQGLKPKHSADRTDAGDAWARSVSSRLPRRVGELPYA